MQVFLLLDYIIPMKTRLLYVEDHRLGFVCTGSTYLIVPNSHVSAFLVQ